MVISENGVCPKVRPFLRCSCLGPEGTVDAMRDVKKSLLAGLTSAGSDAGGRRDASECS